jgi:hypothetical protein
MNAYADFNEEARGALRKAKRLIAENKQIRTECDARVLDTLIAMFRSDALVCCLENRRAPPEAGRDAEVNAARASERAVDGERLVLVAVEPFLDVEIAELRAVVAAAVNRSWTLDWTLAERLLILLSFWP